MHQQLSYLALGDSYTIGEAVPLHQSFPYQTVQMLRKKGEQFAAPEIVAKTGWTTDELIKAMKKFRFQPQYNFVSVLIGVNNQYRGRGEVEFKIAFEEILEIANTLSSKKNNRVFVLSIPDYSITPFAAKMNTKQVSKEISVFNSVIRAVSVQYKVQYVDICEEFKKAKTDPSLLAEDNLHPSAKEYAAWAKKLATQFSKQLK